MTDRSAPPAAARRRLGRATRLAVAGTFAGLLAATLVLAWLQIAVLSELPSRAALQDLGAAAPPSAAPPADPGLADRTAGLLLNGPTPQLKRELQQRLLALRLRQSLTPDEIGRLYAAAAADPPPPDPRPAFYRALAADFRRAAHPETRAP